jgi:hypothetical protein
MGRARNAFTILWDSGWLTDEEVVESARAELRRRHVQEVASAVDHAA